MAFVHSPKVSTDGLVLYLDAANVKSYASGSTSWTDLSGNGNTGTLTNATYSNSTISFDGTGDYVTINGNATMPTASHTIEFVYYNNSGTETYPTLYNRVGQSTTNGFWWVYTYSGVNTTLYWQYSKTDNTTTTLSVSNATTTGAYVHGVITVDYTGYLFKYYKNSQLLSSQALSNTIRTVTTSNTTYIGTYQGISSGYSLQGNIGLFKIYNRVLSSDEILQNFNATRSRFGI